MPCRTLHKLTPGNFYHLVPCILYYSHIDLLIVHWSCQMCSHFCTFYPLHPSPRAVFPETPQGLLLLVDGGLGFSVTSQRGFSWPHYDSIPRHFFYVFGIFFFLLLSDSQYFLLHFIKYTFNLCMKYMFKMWLVQNFRIIKKIIMKGTYQCTHYPDIDIGFQELHKSTPLLDRFTTPFPKLTTILNFNTIKCFLLFIYCNYICILICFCLFQSICWLIPLLYSISLYDKTINHLFVLWLMDI